MATIGKIRQRSGAVIFLIGAAIVLFLISDSLSNNAALFGGGPETSVGEVAGEEVDAKYYGELLDRYLANARQSQNARDLGAAARMQVNNQAWESVIQDRILTAEYDALGLQVGTEEMNDMAFGSEVHSYFSQIPTFQNEQKQFDRTKLKEFIDNFDNVPPESQQIWNDLMEDVKKDRIRSKYFALITKGVYVTQLEAKEDYYGKNQNANFKFVRLKTADLGDSLYNATDEEVKAYAKANGYTYKQNERSIQFVSFPIQPSGKDTLETQNEVNTIVGEFQATDNAKAYARGKTDGSMIPDEFLSITAMSENPSIPAELAEEIFSAELGTVFEPVYDFGTYKIVKVTEEEDIPEPEVEGEERKGFYRASHILIKPEGETDADTATAMAEARKILAQARSGEKTFEELAQEHGTDGTKDKGGDLGWWEDGGMVRNFQKGVESLGNNVGDMTIAKSRFGAHIIKLTAEPLFKRRKVVLIEKKILPSRETGEAAYSAAAGFYDRARTGSEFMNASLELDLNINIAENIKSNDVTIKGLNEARQVVTWAFRENEVDVVSDIFTLDESYVIAMVTEIKVKGELDVISSETEIKDKIIKEKKVAELKEQMESAYTSDLDALASAIGTTVESAENTSFSTPIIPNLGNENKVLGAIFALEDGQVSDVIVGDEGVYVFMLEGYTEVEAPASYAEMQKNLRTSNSASAQVYSLQALKEAANIVDKRYNFY